MENHLSLAFFLLLIILLIFEYRRTSPILLLSFALFALLATLEALQLWRDQYQIQNFFFGGGFGFIVMKGLNVEGRTRIPEKIRQRLFWKIPLVVGLIASAVAQRVGEGWLFVIPILISLLFLRGNKGIWWWIVLCLSLTSGGLKLFCDLEYISNFTCVLAIYASLRGLRS